MGVRLFPHRSAPRIPLHDSHQPPVLERAHELRAVRPRHGLGPRPGSPVAHHLQVIGPAPFNRPQVFLIQRGVADTLRHDGINVVVRPQAGGFYPCRLALPHSVGLHDLLHPVGAGGIDLPVPVHVDRAEELATQAVMPGECARQTVVLLDQASRGIVLVAYRIPVGMDDPTDASKKVVVGPDPLGGRVGIAEILRAVRAVRVCPIGVTARHGRCAGPAPQPPVTVVSIRLGPAVGMNRGDGLASTGCGHVRTAGYIPQRIGLRHDAAVRVVRGGRHSSRPSGTLLGANGTTEHVVREGVGDAQAGRLRDPAEGVVHEQGLDAVGIYRAFPLAAPVFLLAERAGQHILCLQHAAQSVTRGLGALDHDPRFDVAHGA